ncbi:MAG: hypothetical protein NTY73_01280 [Candidatus Micrarchaeota archaeon]|nr:hypothetical protein [Candidatus Micrarchaeota archaeon]
MKEYNILLSLLFIAVLSIIYICYPKSEPTISFSEFKNELNNSKNVSIVVDMRLAPSSGPSMDCGVGLVQHIEMKGIVTRYFFYDSNGCSYGGSAGSGNTSIETCQSMLNDPIVFYIQYDPERNSTSFYKSKAVIEGDSSFLEDCAISRLIGS